MDEEKTTQHQEQVTVIHTTSTSSFFDLPIDVIGIIADYCITNVQSLTDLYCTNARLGKAIVTLAHALWQRISLCYHFVGGGKTAKSGRSTPLKSSREGLGNVILGDKKRKRDAVDSEQVVGMSNVARRMRSRYLGSEERTATTWDCGVPFVVPSGNNSNSGRKDILCEYENPYWGLDRCGYESLLPPSHHQELLSYVMDPTNELHAEIMTQRLKSDPQQPFALQMDQTNFRFNKRNYNWLEYAEKHLPTVSNFTFWLNASVVVQVENADEGDWSRLIFLQKVPWTKISGFSISVTSAAYEDCVEEELEAISNKLPKQCTSLKYCSLDFSGPVCKAAFDKVQNLILTKLPFSQLEVLECRMESFNALTTTSLLPTILQQCSLDTLRLLTIEVWESPNDDTEEEVQPAVEANADDDDIAPLLMMLQPLVASKGLQHVSIAFCSTQDGPTRRRHQLLNDVKRMAVAMKRWTALVCNERRQVHHQAQQEGSDHVGDHAAATSSKESRKKKIIRSSDVVPQSVYWQCVVKDGWRQKEPRMECGVESV